MSRRAAGVVVIAASMFDPHGFDSGDGDKVHITVVPKRLKKWIGKAKRQNVLHRFFAQIMIDPEDLAWVKKPPLH
jgi:hypothetical protein